MFADRVDTVGLGRGDLGRQVRAGHGRGRQHLLQQAVAVAVDARDATPHGTPLAQVPGQRPGVDPADTDDAVGLELVVQRALRAPTGGSPCRVAHDVAGDPDAARLRVLIVYAGVADVRCGLHDNLAVVGRIGERLLIAGHAGGEDSLANCLAARPVGLTGERPSVLEHQDRRAHFALLSWIGLAVMLAHPPAPCRPGRRRARWLARAGRSRPLLPAACGRRPAYYATGTRVGRGRRRTPPTDRRGPGSRARLPEAGVRASPPGRSMRAAHSSDRPRQPSPAAPWRSSTQRRRRTLSLIHI